MANMCTCCTIDSAGNHEPGCPFAKHGSTSHSQPLVSIRCPLKCWNNAKLGAKVRAALGSSELGVMAYEVRHWTLADEESMCIGCMARPVMEAIADALEAEQKEAKGGKVD